MPMTWLGQPKRSVPLPRDRYRVSFVPRAVDKKGFPLAYIDALPKEVLLKIFTLASAWLDAPSTCRAPLNISHTCRHWRALVISTSSLWSSLGNSYPSYAYIDGRMAKLYLKRAGKIAPLDLYFSQGPSFQTDSECLAYFRSVFDAQTQLRHLKLGNSFNNQGFGRRIKIVFTHLPNLEDLNLSRVLVYAGDKTPRYGATCMCPILRLPSYRVTEGPIAPRLSALELLIDEATALQESGLLNLLRHCPSLKELVLTFYPSTDNVVDMEEARTDCELPLLETFRLHGYLGRLLTSCLVVPKLKDLTLMPDDWDEFVVAIDELPRVLKKSRSKVEDVILFQEYEELDRLTDDEQLRLFDSIGDVRSLWFVVGSTEFTVQQLSFAPSGQRKLPKLETLHMLFLPEPEPVVDLDAIVEMIVSRIENSRTFTAHLYMPYEEDVDTDREAMVNGRFGNWLGKRVQIFFCSTPKSNEFLPWWDT